MADSPFPILRSSAVAEGIGSGLAFCGWSYAAVAITLVPTMIPSADDPAHSCCLDTGCGVTLVDKSWLLKQLPEVILSTIATLLRIRGIGATQHESNEFVCTPIYFLGKDVRQQQVYASINRELHLVDGWKANVLIGNDIVGPEAIAINVNTKTKCISSCNVTIAIAVKQRRQFIYRKILAAEPLALPPPDGKPSSL